MVMKHGHSIKVNDIFYYPMPDNTTQLVIVLDKWQSKMHRGYAWMDLWSYGPNVISRHVAVVGIYAFTPVYDVIDAGELMIGTSSKPYALSVRADR